MGGGIAVVRGKGEGGSVGDGAMGLGPRADGSSTALKGT